MLLIRTWFQGERVEVSFVTGHPRNDPQVGLGRLTVSRNSSTVSVTFGCFRQQEIDSDRLGAITHMNLC